MSYKIPNEVKVVLFDWGDTLMVDDPTQCGPMKDWPQLQAVVGVEQLLPELSTRYPLYVASGARDSDANDIAAAFARLDLDSYFQGYYCSRQLQLDKRDTEFYRQLSLLLDTAPEQILMVGNSLATDIRPAQRAGLHVCWFNPAAVATPQPQVNQIQHLIELI